ncbi:membrane-spanning 4-domains subfamily A member 4A [Scomber scombrus]|uniref:Membrane-spanning 4-domains subfamily A member 4A n=1 Tax=Scomber scombrus TaxID=13677 RepID=A0AAV1QEH4_SCOSC|nr:membrane-spanning 4-domains subfamily A member 4A [Scomber scombrus]XP_062278062.1 membrane-spanning 4-domains subfamily A member 4A [Scomber scombrus]
MASTSISKIGGVVVVTQVIPQDETSIQLQNPAAPPTPPSPPSAPSAPPTKTDDMAAIFLRGEPQGLGLVQIFIGLLSVLFSLTAVYSPILIIHAPFSVAIAFVVSGSLAVAASRTPSVHLVWASLLSNVLSAVLSVASIVYLCWILAGPSPAMQLCRDERFGDESWTRCSRNMWSLNVILYALRIFVLILLVLQLCIVISVSVFSGKAVRRSDRYAPIMVMVDNGSDVDLLGSEGKETS